jgi:hypothetical protein
MSADARPGLDSLPFGGPFPEGHKWAPGSHIEVYAKYDDLSFDSQTNLKLWGRWCQSAEAACENRGVDAYILRSELRSFEYVQHCSYQGPSSSGVYKVVAVIANATQCMLNEWTPKPVGYVHTWCSPQPPNAIDPQAAVDPQTPAYPCEGWTVCKECLRDGTWSAPYLC